MNKNFRFSLIIILTPLFLLVFLFVVLNRSTTFLTDPEVKTLDTLASHIIPLNSSKDLDYLVEGVGQSNFVLLGESSHGTSEYYQWRNLITRELISRQGFNYVAVEGDWASLYEVNKYVKHLPGSANSGREILLNFNRWPVWMWANEEFLELVEWLREYNQDIPLDKRVGIYGKDVYGITDSINKTLDYLVKVDPRAAGQAASAFSCLIKYEDNYQQYVSDYFSTGEACDEGLAEVVDNLRQNHQSYSVEGEKEYFNAKQNALVVKHGELYYRTSGESPVTSWNNRVFYMKQTVSRLHDFYGENSAKGIVWAHNTHVGDARATEMVDVGMINIGQLLRERYGQDNVFIVGFGTYQGQVLAASSWGARGQIMVIPPAAAGSYEDLFNKLKVSPFLILLGEESVTELLKEKRGHRAKGVTYNPQTEQRNYVLTNLPMRYNAFIFFKETNPLTPLNN